MRRTAVALALVAVVLALAVAGCGKNSPKAICESFLGAVQAGDYDTAYSLLSKAAQNETTLADFTAAMQAKDTGGGKLTKFAYKKGTMNGNTSNYTYSVTRTKDGKDSVVELRIGLYNDGGKWGIKSGY